MTNDPTSPYWRPSRCRREPIYQTLADGSQIVLVPLAGEPDPRTGQPAFATLDRASFDSLCRGDSRMSDQWGLFRGGKGGKWLHVRGGEPFCTIARVLMKAGQGHVVKHIDGNPLNLQLTNLELKSYGSGGRGARLKAGKVPVMKQKAPDPQRAAAAAEVIKEFLRTGKATRRTIDATGVLARAVHHDEMMKKGTEK